jgi:signal transduction histidine kinase
MLLHSRTFTGEKVATDLNALCEEYLRLAYHGIRAKDQDFNADFETHLDPALPKVEVVPQDIGRVLLNLINNGFQATSLNRDPRIENRESKIIQGIADLGLGASSFAEASRDKAESPKVTVTTKNLEDKIQITISDNGPGIPDDIKDKIFQPFFTTKPTGEGTGLGLSLAYDIVKAHGGEISVESKEGIGSDFILELPLNEKVKN